MPLDPNISLSYQPPQIQSPLAAIGQVQALKNQQLQSQSAQLELQQQQRQMAAQQAMGTAMANAFKANPDGSMEFDTPKIAERMAAAGFGYAIPGLTENLNKANASIADLQKKQADLLETQNDLKGFTANAIKEHFTPQSLIGGVTALSAHKLIDGDAANQAVQDIQAHQDDLNYLHQKYDPLLDQLIGTSKGVQTMRGTQMRGEAQMGELRLKQRTTALNALAGAPNDAAYQQTLAKLQDSGISPDVLKEFQGAWTPERQQQLVSLTQTPQERIQAAGQAADALQKQVTALAVPLAQAADRGNFTQALAALPKEVQARFQNLGPNPKGTDILRAALTPEQQITAAHQQRMEEQEGIRTGLEQGRYGLALKEFEQKYGEPLANAKPEDMLRYQAILRGDMPMPSPRSVGGQKTADAVLALAQQQGDTYTENRYLTRKAFKNGTDAQQLQNLTTALGHAERGLDNSTNLGFNPTVGTRFPTTGAAAYGQDVELGSAELAKLAAAGAITEGDHQRLAKDLRDTREGVRNAAWKEMIDLVGSRVQGMEQKFKTGTGQDINPAEFYSPQTQQRMRRFGIGRVAETPATGTGVPTSTSAAAPQTHKVGDTVNLKGGRTAKVTAVYPDGTFDAQ